jgi:hypothetical protein
MIQFFLTHDTINTCGFAFVDDSDIIASSGYSNNLIHTLEKMQKTIDCWQGVAKSTGRALKPSKSWWYLIQFKWINGKWDNESRNNMVEDIRLLTKDKDDIRTELKYLEVDEAQKMLGVHLSPDRSNKAQFNIMLNKTKQYSEMIRTGHILKHEAWIALTIIAMKSLEYAVPALTLSREEYTKLCGLYFKRVYRDQE